MAKTNDILKYLRLDKQDRKNGTRERLKAPKGKFRVIGVDTFEGPTADYLIGDYASLGDAIAVAKQKGGVMNPVYVYDESGKEVLFKAGKY